MYPANEAERIQWPTGPRALGPGPLFVRKYKRWVRRLDSKNQWFSAIYDVACWPVLGLSWPLLACLGALLGPLGALLGAHGALLGLSWGPDPFSTLTALLAISVYLSSQ